MPEKLLAVPKAQLAGAHQLVAPVPIDGLSYREPKFVGGWQTADVDFGSSASATQSGLVVPYLAPTTAVVQVVGTGQYTWDNTLRTSWTVNYPTVVGGIKVDDLVVMDWSIQEASTPGAPNTPASWTSRGSFHNGSPWVPRVTRFAKLAAGGETGGITVTHGTSTRMHCYIRVIRGVEPSNWFDVPGPAAAYGQGGNPDPASNGPSALAGAFIETVLAGNNFPDGQLFFEDGAGPDGYHLDFENVSNARYFVGVSRVLGGAGSSDNPTPFTLLEPVDNWTTLTDIYKPKVSAEATMIVITAVIDETNTGVVGVAPVIPNQNTVQRIVSTLTAGTFTLTYLGQTTAAINFNDSAATVQTRLQALSTIGAGNVTCTGGPLNLAPVDVAFTGTFAGTDVTTLITASSGSVSITKIQSGASAVTFSYEGAINTPQTVGPDHPQIHLWAAKPAVWPTNRDITFTVSDHANNRSWAAGLLLVSELAGNPIADTFGTAVVDTAESVAQFGTITPATPGSRVLAIIAKGPTGLYSTSFPVTTTPARYTPELKAVGDGITLQAFSSGPVAAGVAERLSTVSWAGIENYADGLVALTPAISAGTLTSIQALNSTSNDSYLELANASGSLSEVFELDLSTLPADAILSSIAITFSHSSNVRSSLRVAPVGIRADGSFVVGVERRVGGYQLDQPDVIQEQLTGDWTELSDGSQLADYSRLGVMIFSTSRYPGLSYHRLHSLSAQVTYETGGPVISNVAGPGTAGQPITWDYSASGGLPQSAVRVVVMQGGNWDLSDPDGFNDYYYEGFNTPGPGASVLPTTAYTLYEGDSPGFISRRRAAAVQVVSDGAAEGGAALRITASNGTGGDAGFVVSGGVRVLVPMLYGQFEFSLRSSGDASNIMVPLVRLVPVSGEPYGEGSIDIIQNYANRSTLNPVASRVHRLRLGAYEPYDSADDEQLDVAWTGTVGTSYHTYRLNWLPGSLALSIDGGAFVTLTADPKWVPQAPMYLSIEFDAAAGGSLGASRTMDVGYLHLRKLITEAQPSNPLDPDLGEIVYDSGQVWGAGRRSWSIPDRPLGRGDCTALVKAWSMMPSGVKVESDWGVDEIFNVSGFPPGTQWTVSGGRIYRPSGAELRSTGFNGGVSIGVGGFSDADPDKTRAVAWAWDRFPGSFVLESDIWGADEDMAYDFPGGHITAGNHWSQTALTWVRTVHRTYAMTGMLSPEAEALGITVTEPWMCGMYRICAFPRPIGIPGDVVTPSTWEGADYMTPARLIPQYRENVRQLVDAGLIVTIQDHSHTGANPVMPAAAVSNPTTIDPDDSAFGAAAVEPYTRNTPATRPTSTQRLRDTLKLYDDICTHFPGATSNVWIGLPNEFYTTGRTTNSDNLIVALVRRIRAKGFTGIIVIPLGYWSADLAGLARGDYDSLMTTLEGFGVGYNIVFGWHMYGANYPTAGSASSVPYTWADADAQLAACRNGVPGSGRRYAVVMEECGKATPTPLGLPNSSIAVDIMFSDINGPALARKYSEICAHWWGTGDGPFSDTYALTRGAVNLVNEETAAPHLSGGGTRPWWRITSPEAATKWLTTGGRKFRQTAHAVAALASPLYDPAIASVVIDVLTPAAATRAWLVRSTDRGSSWTLVGPFGVSPNTAARLIDHDAPLAQETLRYQVSYDSGPMTETSAPMDINSVDISTPITSWWLRAPGAPAMNMPIEVAATEMMRPRRVVSAADTDSSVAVQSKPLPRRIKLTVRVRDRATREKLDALLDSGRTLRLVNILGREWQMRVATDVGEQLQRWLALPEEITGLRDAHEISFEMVEVSSD